jgi:hypothetical protein
VEIIERPVDLAIRTQDKHGFKYWVLMEVKTPTKSGKLPNRTDQALQAQFLSETNTPVVTNLEQALNVLKDL